MSGIYQRNAARTAHPFDGVPGLPCRDHHNPEAWFPTTGQPGTEGVNLCRTACPIQQACLTFALTSGQNFGTWGGMTAGTRENLHPDQRAAHIAAGMPLLEQLTGP